jgi:hypothetical protein
LSAAFGGQIKDDGISVHISPLPVFEMIHPTTKGGNHIIDVHAFAVTIGADG